MKRLSSLLRNIFLWLCRHGWHRWYRQSWKRRCLRCGLRQHLDTVGWNGPFVWQTLPDPANWAETSFTEDVGPR